MAVIPNFIEEDDLLKILQLLSEADIKKLSVLNDDGIEYEVTRYNDDLQRYINLPNGTIDFSNNLELHRALDGPVSKIKKEIEKFFDLEVCDEFGYSVTAYTEGDELPAHFDGVESVKTPNGNPHRDISSVLYLNDEFTGGAVSFSEQGITINPKPGMLILFSGGREFKHSVDIITSGIRYIIPQFWAVKNA